MADTHQTTPWGWVRFYAKGVGVRAGRHYWHLRRDPLDVYSERYKVGCNWWQVGRWRLTHRWRLTA
jgi:hypothetical protein